MQVQFAIPTIGPKVYVSVNIPSGWPETFRRDECDAALEKYLDPLKLEDVLVNFAALQSSQRAKFPRSKTNWNDVISYLGDLRGIAHDEVGGLVGIGFWGRHILREREEAKGTN